MVHPIDAKGQRPGRLFVQQTAGPLALHDLSIRINPGRWPGLGKQMDLRPGKMEEDVWYNESGRGGLRALVKLHVAIKL